MNYKSLGELMWTITKNPLMTGITVEDAAESAIRLLKTLKLPLSTVTEVVTKEIVEHKVKLPDTLVKINAIRDTSNGVNLIYSSDPFHSSENNNNSSCGCSTGSYVLQECNIITSSESGHLEISFERLAVDEEGFPMIPDDASLENAIRYHVMYEYLEGMWHIGKITDKVFNHIAQQRDWYVGQASTSMKFSNIDHAVAMANSINRLLINKNAHMQNYKNNGVPETIKRIW